MRSPPTQARRVHPDLPGGGGRFVPHLFAWRAPKVSIGGAFALVSRETAAADQQQPAAVRRRRCAAGHALPAGPDALNLGKLSVGPVFQRGVRAADGAGAVPDGRRAGGALEAGQHCRHHPPLRVAWPSPALAGVGCPSWPANGRPAWRWASPGGVDHRRPSLLQIAARLKSPGLPPPGLLGHAPGPRGHRGVRGRHRDGQALRNRRDVRMAPATPSRRATHDPLPGRRGIETPLRAARGNLELLRAAKVLMPLHPEKRKYLSSAMPMTEAFIDGPDPRHLRLAGRPARRRGRRLERARVLQTLRGWIWGGCRDDGWAACSPPRPPLPPHRRPPRCRLAGRGATS